MEAEELNSLPSLLKEKVVRVLQDHHKAVELQSTFEKQKIEAEQDIFEIQQQLDSALVQIDEFSKRNTELEIRQKEIGE